MSDPRWVPPSPGSEPLVSEHRPRRPYREDARIYARHREAGTTPYTEGEIDARIVANAADLATIDGDGPLAVPFLRELVGIFRHRVFRAPPVSAEDRAIRLRAVPDAEANLQAAERERDRHAHHCRELESIRRRTLRPGLGTSFTRSEWLAVSLFVAMAVEVLGSVKALEAAFGLNVIFAGIFAIAVSVMLITAADQFGNALAGIVRESRAATRLVAAALVAVAMVAGVLAVYSLAQSRETNTEFAAQSSRSAESGSRDLSNATAPSSPRAAAEKIAREGDKRQDDGKAKLDIGFFLPLSILILAGSTLLAFRVEGAAEWNDIEEAVRGAEGEIEDAAGAVEEARAALVRARGPDRRLLLELSAYVEREHDLLLLWIARFEAEYLRFRALEGHPPRELEGPDVPVPAEVLAELLRGPGEAPPPQAAPGGSAAAEGAGSAPGPRSGEEDRPGPAAPPSDGQPPATGPGPASEPPPAPRPPRRPRGRLRSPDGHPPGAPGVGGSHP